MATSYTQRRVVITGIGALSPLGNSLQVYWDGLVAGRSGIRRITSFDPGDLPCQIAGEVLGFVPGDWMDAKEARRMSRASQFAVATTRQALDDAGITPENSDPERTGVSIGVAYGGIEKIIEGQNIFQTKGWQRIGPFQLISVLPNMPSHHAGVLAGAVGPTMTVATACASGTQAVGEGTEFIRRDLADVVIAGGAEAIIHPIPIAGFAAMRGVSVTHNHEPEKALKPFDKNRDGFILSEGCGLFILEELEHARARGARIYAEVIGHASSNDAHHVAQPDPEGEAALRAMKWAMRDAGIGLDEIDYINPHGTGTPVGDATETLAIKKLFGERAYQIPISSTKSMIGHCMGGAGGLEAIACVMTIHSGTIHPTINYETPDPVCDLDYVTEGARRANVRTALSNSFGLGGQNACLVLRRYETGEAGSAEFGP